MSDPTILHTEPVPVRWGDMDALGHVNNARYFTYAEQARIAWLATLFPDGGLGGEDSSGGPILARISADYRAPVHHPVTVSVEVLAGDLGRTSMQQGYRLRVDGQTVCEMEATIVWMSAETGRPTPLPQRIRDAVEGA